MPVKRRSTRAATVPGAGSLGIFQLTPDDLKANQRGHSTAPVVSFQLLGA